MSVSSFIYFILVIITCLTTMLSPTTDADVSNRKSIVWAPDERLVLLVDVPVAILTADGTPSLEGLNTTSRAITCTLIRIAIDVSGSPESQTWRLDAGAADSGDPGQVAPADYDATTNSKHWVKVGG